MPPGEVPGEVPYKVAERPLTRQIDSTLDALANIVRAVVENVGDINDKLLPKQPVAEADLSPVPEPQGWLKQKVDTLQRLTKMVAKLNGEEVLRLKRAVNAEKVTKKQLNERK